MPGPIDQPNQAVKWPLKYGRSYGISRGNLIAAFVIWGIFAAILVDLYLLHGADWRALLPSWYEPYARMSPASKAVAIFMDRMEGKSPSSLGARLVGIIWFGVGAIPVWLLFGLKQLTISSSEIVLSGRFETTRIRQDDIAGRRRVWDPSEGHFYIIASRSQPNLTITIPHEIQRDAIFDRWLQALPDLDALD